jgi:hypothetical protein
MLTGSVGGTTAGTAAFAILLDKGTINLGLYSGGYFLGSTPAINVKSDSFTLQAIIDHSGGSTSKTTRFTLGSTPTPIPATAWLLGSGIIGLVGIGRRKNG